MPSPSKEFPQACSSQLEKWNQIVPREISTLFDSTKRAKPLADGERSFAIVIHRRLEVFLHEPLPSVALVGRRNLLAGHIKVESARHVHAILGNEEAESSADSRIDIEHLVSSVARVIAVADIENSAVAEGPHECFGRFRDDLVL